MNINQELEVLTVTMRKMRMGNDYYKNVDYKKLYQRYYYLTHGGKSRYKVKEEELNRIKERADQIPGFKVEHKSVLVSFS